MGFSRQDMVQTSLYDRVSKLLESYEWSDCSFSLSGKKIKAHRLILGISSPVFEAMFYGPMSSDEDIVISDIEPDIFQLLINYIYTDKVEISCIEHAFELLYAAKKYLLEYLMGKCIDYIESNLSVDNVISVLNFSQYIQEDWLITKSLQILGEHAQYVLKESLDKLSVSSIKLILESDKINISEKDLIKVVFKWTELYCETKNIPVTVENRRNILLENNIFAMLRFLSLSLDDIAEVTSDECNILLPSEIQYIRQCNSSNCLSNLVAKDPNNGSGVKISPESKCRDKLKVRRILCHRSLLRSTAPLVIDSSNNKVNVKMKANKTVFIHSLCIPTRMSPPVNFHSDSPMFYSDQFSVSLYCLTDNSRIKFTNFMNTLEYDSNVFKFIEFSEPCVLKKDEWYKITFEWPTNRTYSYKYSIGHRDTVTVQHNVEFQFEDTDTNGSFLESLKFS